MNETLPNWEIAVYALYLKGGASRSVHTEDVALKCFELAQDSFSWIKYVSYPDKEVARSSLVDARKEKNGRLVVGRAGKGKGHWRRKGQDPEPDGWQLTEAGSKWLSEHEQHLAEILKQAQPKVHRQEVLRKLERIRRHPLFKIFIDEPDSFVPPIGSLAELLRCRVDSHQSVWRERFASLRNQAELAKQADVLAFLDRCEEVLPDIS